MPLRVVLRRTRLTVPVLELTPFPPRLFHEGRKSYRANIVSTADFLRQSHPTVPVESLETMEMYDLPAPSARPDEHLACIDTAYWFIEQPARFDLHDEWRRGLGVWSAVGRFARWRPEVEALGMAVGRRVLGVGEGEEMPPVSASERARTGRAGEADEQYIAIHVRRGGE